jgi:PAS domain S-box-containing protein
MTEPIDSRTFSAEFESTFAAAPVGLAVFDREGRYVRVNAELAHINGLPADEHVGRSVHQVVPGLGDEVARVVAGVFDTGETVRDLEVSGQTPSRPGEVRHWLCGFYPIRGASGEVRAVGAWVTEITERKRALEELHLQKLKLQMGIQAAGLVMAEIDYRTNLNHISGELARLLELGDGPSTVPRQAIFDRIHPDDRDRYLRAIAEAVDPRGTGHLAIDVRAQLPSGQVRWLHIRLQVTFAMVDGQLRPDRGICAARDVTAERVAELRLRDAQRMTESVIEGAGALVFAKDLKGRYFLFNQAWRLLHDLTPEQASGITDAEIFGEKTAAALRANDEHVLRTGEPMLVQERAVLRGRPVVFRSSKFPLYDETGRPYAVCGVSTDISDVVEADQRKDEFIATLAHELRNPLAPIRTGLEILRRVGALPPAAMRTRDMMERQLTHMVRLVDDLLDVSRISRGKLELRIAPVDLPEAVAHAIEASQPMIDAAGHRLAVALAEEPLRVQGDLTRLAQIVSNLLNNAAKYTPPGGDIRLACRREGVDAVVEVRDNGNGIAAHQLPTMFRLFAQGRTEQGQRPEAGLGIGLWLVKQLVELHHGRIEAESPGPGQGSTFIVRIPLASPGAGA